jgi:hypothetical protein
VAARKKMTAADNGMSSLKLMGLVHVRSRNEYFVWRCSNLTEINDFSEYQVPGPIAETLAEHDDLEPIRIAAE